MDHVYLRSPLRVRFHLTFDLCLNAVRSILLQEKLDIIFEGLFPEQRSGTPRRPRVAVLVAWSSSYLYRNTGFLPGLCMSIFETGTYSILLASHCTHVAAAAEPVGMRMLARTLDAHITHTLIQLSVHESAYGAITQGGGIYRGIQYGSRERGLPDLVLFDDPVTKTTLALPLDGSPVCPKAVRRRIKDSRKVFHVVS